MQRVSVIIITHNEEEIIGRTLASVNDITDDIIIVDNGSNDRTLEIAKSFGARILQTSWDGFGKNKNKGIDMANHDWILSIDADELIDETLRAALLHNSFLDPTRVYTLKFRTFIAGVGLRYGQSASEKHIRIFNKNFIRWNNAEVHEELLLPTGTRILPFPGYVLHHSYKDIRDYMQKCNAYTSLRAMEMFRQGKKANMFKLYLNPLYTFILNYFFRVGFLDGFWGYTYAKLSSTYSYLKYAKLKELYSKERKGIL